MCRSAFGRKVDSRATSCLSDDAALKQREVRHFGYAFDYELQGVRKDAPLAEPIPEECAPFLSRLVASGRLSGLPDQLTVTRYLPGQGEAQGHIRSCVLPVLLVPAAGIATSRNAPASATSFVATSRVLLMHGTDGTPTHQSENTFLAPYARSGNSTVLTLPGLKTFCRAAGKFSLGTNWGTGGAPPTLGVNQSDRTKNPTGGCGYGAAVAENVTGYI